MMKDRSEIWLKSLCKILGNTIYKLGEQFSIYSEYVDEREKE